MLVGLGLLHTLLRAYTASLTSRSIAVGQGMAIIAALLGALAASRQILLHILPGDPGFGSPVFGLVRPTSVHVVLHRLQSSDRGERYLAHHDHVA